MATENGGKVVAVNHNANTAGGKSVTEMCIRDSKRTGKYKDVPLIVAPGQEDEYLEVKARLDAEAEKEKKADFLRRLYRTVYLRDIYERNNIERRPEFEELSKTVASSIGAVSYTHLSSISASNLS